MITKDIQADTYIKIEHLTEGLAQLESCCSSCKQRFNTWFDNKEEIWLFKCQHVFHARCIAKNDGMCSICFNELDAFRKCLSSCDLFRVDSDYQQDR